jgi:hypothetical protein
MSKISQAVPSGVHGRSVMIATPMYGGMCTGHYMAGVIGAIAALSANGVSVYFANLMNESLITRARNELARQFLEQGFDFLMFIDADIAFDGGSVMELLAVDRDIVCGIYPRKEISWEGVEQAARRGEHDLRKFSGVFAMNLPLNVSGAQTDEMGLIEVQHGATGFMLIKRCVFEQLGNHVPEYRISSAKSASGDYLSPMTKEFFATSIDGTTGVLLSEDYHFCESWRKLGGKIHVKPSIRLEHVGTYVYGGGW